MRSAAWTGAFLGIGLMGALDEIAFHQVLQWHSFYVHADRYWRVVSDGAFHVFTTAMLLLGALRLWRHRRRLAAVERGRPFWAALLMGAGGFQLFDGIVSHKLLQLHPVREGVEHIWAYDLAWNVPAVLIFLAGWALWRGSRHDRAAPEADAAAGADAVPPRRAA